MKKQKALEAKEHFKVQMFDMNAQLERQKDTFDKHIDD